MCWLWAKTQCNAHKATTAKLNLRKLIIQTGSAKANKVIWVKYFIFPCFVKTARGITQIWGDMDVVQRKLGNQNNQQTSVLCYFLFPCSVPVTEGILNKTAQTRALFARIQWHDYWNTLICYYSNTASGYCKYSHRYDKIDRTACNVMMQRLIFSVDRHIKSLLT